MFPQGDYALILIPSSFAASNLPRCTAFSHASTKERSSSERVVPRSIEKQRATLEQGYIREKAALNDEAVSKMLSASKQFFKEESYRYRDWETTEYLTNAEEILI